MTKEKLNIETVNEKTSITYSEDFSAVKKMCCKGLSFQNITFEKGKYYVIHGSLPSDADCAKHVRQACLQKYNPSILITPGDWHRRVCLGVFTSESEAESFASNINKAWVKSE